MWYENQTVENDDEAGEDKPKTKKIKHTVHYNLPDESARITCRRQSDLQGDRTDVNPKFLTGLWDDHKRPRSWRDTM